MLCIKRYTLFFPKLLLSWKLYEAGGRDDTRPWKVWKHWLCATNDAGTKTSIAPAGQGSALGTSLWLPALSRDPGLSGGIDHTNDVRSWRHCLIQQAKEVTAYYRFLSFPVRECREEAAKVHLRLNHYNGWHMTKVSVKKDALWSDLLPTARGTNMVISDPYTVSCLPSAARENIIIEGAYTVSRTSLC